MPRDVDHGSPAASSLIRGYVTISSRRRDARVPFIECYGEPSNSEGLGKDHSVPRLLFRAAVRLMARRPHCQFARRHHHHLGTAVAFLEAVARPERAFLRQRFGSTGQGRRSKDREDKKDRRPSPGKVDHGGLQQAHAAMTIGGLAFKCACDPGLGARLRATCRPLVRLPRHRPRWPPAPRPGREPPAASDPGPERRERSALRGPS